MRSVALYKLPRDTYYTYLEQTSGEPLFLKEISELNGREGFVMAPFEITKDSPLILMLPDVRKKVPIGESFLKENILTVNANNSRKSVGETYKSDFNKFHNALEHGELHKIVLARSSKFRLSHGIDEECLFLEACRMYPNLFVALVSTGKSGTWLMATPEILLANDGKTWSTMALAGTMGMKAGGMTLTDWSEKNRLEQKIVSDYIRKCLKHWTNDIEERGPYTTNAGRLCHLRTDFYFQIQDPHHIGDLLAELHPTPAVCGLPKKKAQSFILANESNSRRYYSGFAGMLSIKGNSHLFVSLRCMQIQGNDCRLYAGGGLLKESELQSEWEETEAKMEIMKQCIQAKRI